MRHDHATRREGCKQTSRNTDTLDCDAIVLGVPEAPLARGAARVSRRPSASAQVECRLPWKSCPRVARREADEPTCGICIRTKEPEATELSSSFLHRATGWWDLHSHMLTNCG
eukprot:5217596-Prymnesium_polylepis.1